MKKDLNNKMVISLCLFIITLGFLLRLFLIFSRNIFVDEVFYTEVARFHTVSDIVLIKSWIKDHAILYFLFLKPFLSLTNNIIYLRFTNLVLYIISSLSVFVFFNLFGFGYWSLLPVFLYSFHRYFVYLNSMVSIFSLVLFFAVLSILSLSYFVFFKKKIYKKLSYFLFIIFTVLGFYSDYSFFYMFFFYLFILLYVLLSKKSVFLYVLIAYLLIISLILPGIFQFFGNFDQINYLFQTFSYKNSNFVAFVGELSRILVFRISAVFSLLYIVLLFFITLFVNKKNKYCDLYQLNIVFFLSFFVNIVLLFFFVNYLFSIFIERSFWFFYFILTVIITITSFLLAKQKKLILSLLFITFFFLVSLNNYFNPSTASNIPGEVSYNVPYNNLINRLINDDNQIKNVIFVDERYTFYPLMNYFFSGLYPQSGKFSKEIDNFVKGKFFTRVKSFDEINKSYFFSDQKTLLVLFFPSQSVINYLSQVQKQNKNLIVYYFGAINKNRDDFIRL